LIGDNVERHSTFLSARSLSVIEEAASCGRSLKLRERTKSQASSVIKRNNRTPELSRRPTITYNCIIGHNVDERHAGAVGVNELLDAA
jgi:hypothetical protein